MINESIYQPPNFFNGANLNSYDWTFIADGAYTAGSVNSWNKGARGGVFGRNVTGDTGNVVGHLTCVVRKGSPAATNPYWRLRASWEDLGVPLAGSQVLKVDFIAYVRFFARGGGGKNSHTRFSTLQFGSGDAYGFANIRDRDNTLAVYDFTNYTPPVRTALDQWQYAPANSSEGEPINFNQSSWATIGSNSIIIPTEIRAQEKNIEIRIGAHFPPTNNAYGSHDWLGMKIHSIFIRAYSQQRTFHNLSTD